MSFIITDEIMSMKDLLRIAGRVYHMMIVEDLPMKEERDGAIHRKYDVFGLCKVIPLGRHSASSSDWRNA